MRMATGSISNDVHPRFSDVSNSVYQPLLKIEPSTTVKKLTGNSKRVNSNFYTFLNDHFCQNNFPGAHNDNDFYSLLLKDLKYIEIRGHWTSMISFNFNNAVVLSRKRKKFGEYACEVVDGFKYIIKNPDKLISISVS
ncbi:hypothetical protein C1637_11695 [Chryseobacterium lactis]|uniref:Uncharacterized protein n=2 Tax=Chryseobacterium lactis TaxID=1241981 RepID=A0A3G6RLH6_CHRLC|nr:hypothetical protein EG342_02245 [Chryseobacterium lactis]AZB05811.1 hypothetical protein EG341_18370 [Chryseobacterium lactis]PNW13470.1 hypothetical protein C1637_11695 [Chryseobacterium lactis]